MSMYPTPFDFSFTLSRILIKAFMKCIREKISNTENTTATNAVLASLDGVVEHLDPQSQEYRTSVKNMSARLQKYPELSERIVFYAKLAQNGDVNAKTLLDTLDETGYLRIACMESMQPK